MTTKKKPEKPAIPAHKPKRKLYVHIGMHKTGTTAIQRFSAKNRAFLKSAGITYPTFPLEVELGFVHHFLLAINSCVGDESRAFILDSFDNLTKKQIDEASKDTLLVTLFGQINENNDDILLSSEAFYLLDEISVEKFGKIFHNFDIVPILYYRNFSDWMTSYYDTYIFYSKGKMDLLKASWNPFNIKKYCDNWSAVAYDGKVRLVSYDALRKEKRSLLAYFFSALNISVPKQILEAEASENTSNRPDVIVMARELRKSGAGEGEIAATVNLLSARKSPHKQRLLSEADTIKYDTLYLETMQSLLGSPKVSGLTQDDIIIPERNFVTERSIITLNDALKSLLSLSPAEAVAPEDRKIAIDHLLQAQKRLHDEFVAKSNAERNAMMDKLAQTNAARQQEIVDRAAAERTALLEKFVEAEALQHQRFVAQIDAERMTLAGKHQHELDELAAKSEREQQELALKFQQQIDALSAELTATRQHLRDIQSRFLPAGFYNWRKRPNGIAPDDTE